MVTRCTAWYPVNNSMRSIGSRRKLGSFRRQKLAVRATVAAVLQRWFRHFQARAAATAIALTNKHQMAAANRLPVLVANNGVRMDAHMTCAVVSHDQRCNKPLEEQISSVAAHATRRWGPKPGCCNGCVIVWIISSISRSISGKPIFGNKSVQYPVRQLVVLLKNQLCKRLQALPTMGRSATGTRLT